MWKQYYFFFRDAAGVHVTNWTISKPKDNLVHFYLLVSKRMHISSRLSYCHSTNTYCTKGCIIFKIFRHASFQNTQLSDVTVVSTSHLSTLSMLVFPIVGGCRLGLSAVARFNTNSRARSLFKFKMRDTTHMVIPTAPSLFNKQH